MMLNSLKPTATPARLAIARSTRVFTDSEWDAATKTAASMLAVLEQGESAEGATADAPDAGIPAPEGRSFSDSQWDAAMKKAPMLLKELERIEEGAAEEGGEASGSTPSSSGVASGDKVFTPEQWDAAIKIAIAAEQAEAKKAEIDDNLNAMKMDAAALAPPVDGPTVSDVMAFSGSAPELTNGRVAMLAFVSAAGAELTTGQSVSSQFMSAPAAVLASVALVTVASLVPLLSKEGDKMKAVGPFNPDAELANGRAAMIGITALSILEVARSGALF